MDVRIGRVVGLEGLPGTVELSVPPGEILDDLQANCLTFLWVELGRKQIVVGNRSAKIMLVASGQGDDIRIGRLDIVGVNKVNIGVGRNSLEQRRFMADIDSIPAHVGNFVGGRQLKLADVA